MQSQQMTINHFVGAGCRLLALVLTYACFAGFDREMREWRIYYLFCGFYKGSYMPAGNTCSVIFSD